MAEVLRFVPSAIITGVELQPRLADAAEKKMQSINGDWHVLRGDVLDRARLAGSYDYAIFNPPFELAREFAARAMEIAKTVAMLCRTGWMESCPWSKYPRIQERARFLAKHPPELGMLDKRPSFTGDGKHDATAYSWYFWGPDAKAGTWTRLPLVQAECEA